jgi:hypothetical protein
MIIITMMMMMVVNKLVVSNTFYTKLLQIVIYLFQSSPSLIMPTMGVRDTRPPPLSRTEARQVEVCADGGEVAFVGNLIDDSKDIGTRIAYVLCLKDFVFSVFILP